MKLYKNKTGERWATAPCLKLVVWRSTSDYVELVGGFEEASLEHWVGEQMAYEKLVLTSCPCCWPAEPPGVNGADNLPSLWLLSVALGFLRSCLWLSGAGTRGLKALFPPWGRHWGRRGQRGVLAGAGSALGCGTVVSAGSFRACDHWAQWPLATCISSWEAWEVSNKANLRWRQGKRGAADHGGEGWWPVSGS